MTQEEFQILFDEHKQSGLSQLKFCKQKGLAISTFGYWRRKMLRAKTGKGFIELDTQFDNRQIEITLPNQIVIRLPAGLSTAEIKAVLEAAS